MFAFPLNEQRFLSLLLHSTSYCALPPPPPGAALDILPRRVPASGRLQQPHGGSQRG